MAFAGLGLAEWLSLAIQITVSTIEMFTCYGREASMAQGVEGASADGGLSGRRLLVGFAAMVIAIAIWAALRAYTSIFGILNLRVFVGAFIIIIPLVAAGAFQKTTAPLKVMQSLLGVVTLVGGEGLGSLLADKPIVVDKFTAIYFAVAITLPWLPVSSSSSRGS
jgi:hypothetical protein